MVVRVGINGFGRIGRVIFRACFQNQELQITAINDPAVDIEYICYLIKFDSTHGKFKSNVSFLANEINIDDKKIKVFCEKLPSNIPWQSAAVEYVVEASGMFTNLDKASGHLASDSVKRVIITAPTVDVPMLILGVNMEQINAEQKVISCASSTLYCLAPIIKILEDNYGVTEGFITSIHAMTPSLKPLDGLCLRGKHWRDHRSIHQNIIPAVTGACKALGKIIPQVKDKMTGLAFRVPIVNVSVLDITVRLNKNTTIQDIMKCVETESKSHMKNIIKISKDQEVSSDFLGDENSCIFDVNSSLQLNPKFFKLICWYENEYSYACRVMDSIKYSEENQCKLKIMAKIPFDRIIASKQSIHRKSIPYFNKEYVTYNCHTENNQKIMFSTSQETDFKGKALHRPISFKRPLLLQNSRSNQLATQETKKRNEMFKVWNDEAQVSRPLVKEQRNAFFQSCMTLAPSSIHCNNYLKTHERLEEVKKEFSKMVNMTENLLKTSNHSKCEITILEQFEKEVGKNNKRYDEEFCNMQSASSSIIKNVHEEVNEESQASIGRIYKDIFKTYKKENPDISVAKNISELSEISKTDGIQQIKTNCNEVLRSNVNIDNLDNRQNENDVSRKATDSWKIQHNTCKVEIYDLERNVCATTLFNSDKIPKIINSQTHNTAPELPKSYTETSNQDNTQIKKMNTPKNDSDDILIDDTDIKNTNKSNLNLIAPSVTGVKTEFNEPDKDIFISKKERRKKIIEGIIKKLSETTQEDRIRSPSLVNTNTTISNGECYRSLDIYDKLDSASATDSDNSFQIHEKKSQIIDITDLTSSAEDLARLDKICRIIEISDELSDKLFSVLDNNDQKFKKKKWSFKDLCERLKLDEFCNNIFGQSTS